MTEKKNTKPFNKVTNWYLFSNGASRSNRPEETRKSLTEDKQTSFLQHSWWFWVGFHSGMHNLNSRETLAAENWRSFYPLTELPDLTTRPALTLQQSRQLTYHKLIHAFRFFFFLLFIRAKSVECWETRSPCGNRELTSHLHKFRWCIIIKGSRGEYVHFKDDSVSAAEHHCRVWPWLRLRPSSPGIPASQLCPEQKAPVTCCRRNQRANELHVYGERLPPAANQLAKWRQTINTPSGKLNDPQNKEVFAASKASYYLQKSPGRYSVCLPQSLVLLLGDVRREWSATKILLHWKKSFSLCTLEMTQNTELVFINFCLCCGTVQSRPVCLFKNPGLAAGTLSRSIYRY